METATIQKMNSGQDLDRGGAERQPDQQNADAGDCEARSTTVEMLPTTISR